MNSIRVSILSLLLFSVAHSQVSYSTYFGGYGDDDITCSTFDALGNSYIAGRTTSLNLAVTTASTFKGKTDAFVASISKSGSPVIGLYFGGSGDDAINSIALEPTGNIIVVGTSTSTDLPVTIGSHSGCGSTSAFAAKFTPTGALVWARYLCGNGMDEARDVVVSVNGQIGVVGTTTSTNFPITTSVVLSGTSDAFVAVLDSNGGITFGTLLGGSAMENGNAVAFIGAILVVAGATSSLNFPVTQAYRSYPAGGFDAFITTIDPTSGTVTGSTYLGGLLNDEIVDIVVSGTTIYVVGNTNSRDLPVFGAWQSAINGFDSETFIAAFPTTATATFVSYFGGSGKDAAKSINVYGSSLLIAGTTTSPDLPVSVTAVQNTLQGGSDAYYTVWDVTGYAVAGGYFGGMYNDEGVAIFPTGVTNMTVVGNSVGSDLVSKVGSGIVAVNSGSYDGFLVSYSIPAAKEESTTTIAAYTGGQITFGKSNRSAVTGALVGGLLGGFLGAAVLFAGGLFMWKKMRDD